MFCTERALYKNSRRGGIRKLGTIKKKKKKSPRHLMPGNDVRRSHSSVRPTTQPNGAHIHRSRLSKCQHQRWAKLETHQASGGFAIHIFPRALSGTWQQVTWQPLTSKTASGIISGSTWIVSQPAASLLPPPHPTSSLPNPKSGKTNSGLRATLLLGVPWWPRPEQHARARSSAAIPAGKWRCGSGLLALRTCFR